MTSQWLDDNCNGSPTIDGDYVYFCGGQAKGLYRRRKDGSGQAQELDENCSSTPYVDDNYVYFCGSPGALFRVSIPG
jgi:hypothetical protein